MLLKRLFENLALSVEAFATCLVSAGWRLRLPALDWVTFHFVVDGEGAIRDAGGVLHDVKRDTLAVVPPHLLHAIECGVVQREAAAQGGGNGTTPPAHVAGRSTDAGLTVVCGRVHAVYGSGLGLFDQLREVLVLDFSDSPEMRGIFEALLQEQRGGRPGCEVMMSSLMNQCLVQVFRRLVSQSEGRLPWLEALEDPNLSKVIGHILDHPERPHTVGSLATASNMSRSAFAKRFRESFGRTPMAYVREVRLRRGARLLRQDRRLSVDAVTSRVGFSSRSQFSHAFHEYFGSSPKAFRDAGSAGS